jgi:hypothetical protein
MQAYEFYAIPQNGVLSIPDQYAKKITTRVKVILLEQDSEKLDRVASKRQKRTDLLSPVSINTLGWKFDKEEANER